MTVIVTRKAHPWYGTFGLRGVQTRIGYGGRSVMQALMYAVTREELEQALDARNKEQLQ